jgi:DNA invertase Pin-like site-specific DNA recombinase
MTPHENAPIKRRRRRVNRDGLPMVAYLRVSTRGQVASGLGLDDQVAAITAWANAQSVTISATHQDGTSRVAGSMAKRAGLQAALAEVRSGKAAGLIASKIDRLGSGSDVVALAEEAKRDGWRLVVLDVGLDTATPAGMLVLGVLASVAAFDLERIGERNRAWKHQARVRGEVRGAHAADRTLADRIIAMRDEGMTYRAIAATLIDEGVEKVRGGTTWHPSNVRSIERTRRLEIEAQAAA